LFFRHFKLLINFLNLNIYFLQMGKTQQHAKKSVDLGRPLAILCISSFFKGEEFLRSSKAEGCTTYLVTSEQLRGAAWPRASLDDIFFVKDRSAEKGDWDMDDLVAGLSWLMRTRPIDVIVALDDFDVEKAAHLREHFRIDGMGQTTARFFRDKLAMRLRAQDAGIRVPKFTALFNDAQINHYLDNISFPVLIKPRSEASATGIRKVHSKEQAWEVLNDLGDRRHHYLMEQFKPGDVFHADALSLGGKILFCRISRYLATPMEVAHGGGIFRSMTVDFDGEDDKKMQAMTSEVMNAFRMQYSASHTEFIKDHETGDIIFLETSSRVGGAHLAEMVEASSGINLWREWAKLEKATALGEPYKLPKVRNDYAGILVSLSRFQRPDMSVFDDKEIVWRMTEKEYHVGMIVQSTSKNRIETLLDNYAERVKNDFHASAPLPDKPVS
jgi:hypothetical protein